jgi:hypothetical protein
MGFRQQNWPVVDQGQMEPDPEPRHTPRAPQGVRRRGAAPYETRRAEEAVPMRLLNRLVDRDRQPEIVGSENELLQTETSRRSLRKRKNSTPSCKRRFIISGLRTISPTIAAILGTRK